MQVFAIARRQPCQHCIFSHGRHSATRLLPVMDSVTCPHTRWSKVCTPATGAGFEGGSLHVPGMPQLASGRSSLLEMQHAACPQAADDLNPATGLWVEQAQHSNPA